VFRVFVLNGARNSVLTYVEAALRCPGSSTQIYAAQAALHKSAELCVSSVLNRSAALCVDACLNDDLSVSAPGCPSCVLNLASVFTVLYTKEKDEKTLDFTLFTFSQLLVD
jgi:hypothetical protein